MPSVSDGLSTFIVGEGELWFPGLAPRLAADFWAKLAVPGEIATYTTQGWITRALDTPKVEMGELRIGRYVSSLESLPVAMRRSFADLSFGANQPADWVPQLRAAVKALSTVHGLADSVGSLARSIHVLRAPRNHDVSHSTPDLPFSIFVSVPGADEKDATFRLAESLVHEAMHLQLTLVDRTDALVIDRRRQAYSPWKEDQRPLEGLLHGLYVFAVIHQVLGLLAEAAPRSRDYCAKRRIQIADEVASLPLEPDGLSTLGRALWLRCSTSVSAT